MFVNKHFMYLVCVYRKSKCCYNERPLAYYFYVETKISGDFHVYISVYQITILTLDYVLDQDV